MIDRAREETYERIMDDLGKDPVKVSKQTRLKQGLILFTSEKLLALIVCLITVLVLMIPIIHHAIPKTVAPEEFAVLDHKLSGNVLSLSFKGGTPDIYTSYMESDSGVKVYPKEYNSGKNSLTFECEEKEYNLYIHSQKGSLIQMVLLIEE